MPGLLDQKFVPIPLSAIDHISPLTWQVFDDLRKLQEHVRKAAYDPAAHTPIEGHDHDGVNSALIIVPSTSNLIIDSDPTAEGRNSVNEWEKSGPSLQNEGLRFDSAGYATHRLGDGKQGAAQAKRQFGTGSPIVLAVALRLTAPLTAFGFTMGLTDGHTTATAHEATWALADSRVGWQRFFTYVPAFDPSAFTNAPRMLLRVTSMAPSGEGVSVVARCICAFPSSILPWYEPGYFVQRQHNWELVGWGETPNYDQEMTFDRAIFKEST